MKQNVLQAWKLEMIRLFTRCAAAYEEATKQQRADMTSMRPIILTIKGLKPQAALNPDARAQLLDALDEADEQLTSIMGPCWQPNGQLAQQLRAHSNNTRRLID